MRLSIAPVFTLIGASIAWSTFPDTLVGTASMRALTASICTDQCAATATLTNIPAGSCGDANLPTYEVDWGQSTSGVCDGCQVQHHCDNHAVITILPAAGTYLNGGGFACDGLGGDIGASVTICGQASTSQIHVHTAAPCTTDNYKCTVYVTLGCKNC